MPPSGGSPFSAGRRSWWDALDVPPGEKLRIRHDLAILASLDVLIAEVEVEVELVRLSTTESWATRMPLLLQVPGFWVMNAIILLSAIGDIARFPSAKHPVGYSGLGASVYAAGQTYRTGKMTKQGRRELRRALVEAAWVAVERHAHWKVEFARLSTCSGKGKAIVAIARRLLVAIWHLLIEQVADRHGEPVAVAQKLMRWATYRRMATRQGLSRRHIVRHQLDQLRLGADLDYLPFHGKRLHLPRIESAQLALPAG